VRLKVAVDARPLDIAYLRAQGLGRYAQGLLGPLAAVAEERGGQLVTLRSSLPAPEGFGLEVGNGPRVRRVRRPPVPARLADLPEQLLLPIDLRRCGADVNHALSIYRTAVAPGVPTVMTVHDVAPLMWPERYLRSGTLHRLLYLAARRARLLLADSEAARADIVTHLGVPGERIVTVPLAADASFAPVDPRPAHFLLGFEGPYLLYVGGLANHDWRKNVRGLIEGFAAWHRAQERTETLVLAGGIGQEGRELMRLARELGAPAVFPGFVADADLPALFSGASCFVTASRYEGFGLPALEAISSGTPVAAFHAGAVPEVAGPGALTVADGDVAALMQAAGSVCDDPALRDRLSGDGLHHAKGYSWRRTAELTWDAYERAARPEGTGVPGAI
jgi:glycosyltransferase involved in cell wall biosynthesis